MRGIISVRSAVQGVTVAKYLATNGAGNEHVAVLQDEHGWIDVFADAVSKSVLENVFGWDGNAGFQYNTDKMSATELATLDALVPTYAGNLCDPNFKIVTDNLEFFNTVEEDTFPHNGYEQHPSML